MTEPLHAILKMREGLSLRPYRDRDGWAVGYGHRIGADEWMARIASGRPADISLDEAERFFQQDVASARAWFGRLFGAVVMNAARRDALTAMIYQLGPGGVARFRRMCDAISRADWENAAREALDSRWAKQTSERAREVATMLETGRYPEWLREPVLGREKPLEAGDGEC